MNINHIEYPSSLYPGAGWIEKPLDKSDPEISTHGGKRYKVSNKFEKCNKAALIAVAIVVAIFALPTLGLSALLLLIPGVLPQRKYYAIREEAINVGVDGSRQWHPVGLNRFSSGAPSNTWSRQERQELRAYQASCDQQLQAHKDRASQNLRSRQVKFEEDVQSRLDDIANILG